MKLAAAFILVLISCCFDNSSAANAQTCLTQLLENDAPAFLQELGDLLCNYQVAKTTQNQELFMAFLNGVNKVLGGVGCTLDDLLGTNVVPTLKNAEPIADNVAEILFGFLNNTLGTISDILKNLPPLVSDFLKSLVPDASTVMNVLANLQDLKNLGCDFLESVLPKVAEILKLGGEVLGSVFNNLAVQQKN
ncbi:hypothetical protein GDO86_005510 [Hymenochirus boettgeri]|uniref:Uncharacterized protein n=1 Tax=Hymenochirus boettgeri TaxID=247094 RepID=A0A8T2J4R5_9PIPI|nr:hypothetical protein GDO86_005510 [Hymenochirus boettgeri]